MPSAPSKTLATVPNPHADRDYEVSMVADEFTCVCPMTGQPDFATIRIRYVPDEMCVELKSLKVYLWSFRQEGHYHEAATNRILDDLVALLSPREMTVEGAFAVRGGITTTVVAAPERGSAADLLVVRGDRCDAALPLRIKRGGRVGTSSLRRKAQLLARRKDLLLVDLRGNVPTRVAKVAAGALDAVVLAEA